MVRHCSFIFRLLGMFFSVCVACWCLFSFKKCVLLLKIGSDGWLLLAYNTVFFYSGFVSLANLILVRCWAYRFSVGFVCWGGVGSCVTQFLYIIGTVVGFRLELSTLLEIYFPFMVIFSMRFHVIVYYIYIFYNGVVVFLNIGVSFILKSMVWLYILNSVAKNVHVYGS